MSSPMQTALVASSANQPMDPTSSSNDKASVTPRRPTRKPGRPATYVFDKPDDQLTEKERKMKTSIEKRRLRQNRSYHRRKGRNKSKAILSQPTMNSTPLQSASIPLSSSAALQQSFSAATTMPTVAHVWQAGFTPSAFPPAHDGATVNTMAVAAAPPKFIPGFSQNPLDLLASATAGRCVSSSTAVITASSSHPGVSDASMGDTEQQVGAQQVPEPHVSIPDPMTAAAEAVAVGTSSDIIASTPIVHNTLEIDATATAMTNPSSFSRAFDENKAVVPQTDNSDPTEVLVESAMIAAKEYAKDPLNLKDVMDREIELRRMTGIKTIVFDNLRSKYLGMAPDMQSALRHFIIFPRTFDLNAAAAVAGFEDSQYVMMQSMLDSMIQTNFITTVKGRYELNEAARLFLNEDSTILSDNIAGSTYHLAQKRFISHYRKQLSQLQDDNIHKIGWLREQAMALFDCERENMEFSEFILNGRNDELREFLSAGITVMRYCVSASNRERLLRKALSEDETSTEDISMFFGASGDDVDGLFSGNGGNGNSGGSGSREVEENAKKEDRSHRARLYLALSEAYFDQLKLKDAEQPLLEALELMGDTNLRVAGSSSTNIVDSVLVLLLLSNLRMTEQRVKDARVLCVKALRILAEARLGRSTFGINAMSNLATIYLMEGHLDKAKSVAGRLLDTLNTMRYTGMPIYADALGVCAMVSMAEGNFKEAERQYDRALETVGKWGSKDWAGIPVQHCLDLDLWLMEGLAESFRRQGKDQDALVLEQQAAEDRRTRGLPHNVTIPQILRLNAAENRDPGGGGGGVVEPRPSLRHLY